MEEGLNEVVSDEELKKFERIYFDLLAKQTPSKKAQFEYAWCLVRSKYPVDIKKGIILFEDLYNNDVAGRRDYLYYLSIGHVRIKEYSKALEHCRAFLEIEPTNRQVQELEEIIKKKMNKGKKKLRHFSLAGHAHMDKYSTVSRGTTFTFHPKICKEGKIGIAITMAGVLILGGIVSLGVALSKSKS